MSQFGKEIRVSFFARNPELGYLSEEEKFIFKKPTPRHRFNIIGAGMIGREHIMVTLLEGRATIHGVYDNNSRSNESIQKFAKTKFSQLNLVIYPTLEEACNDPLVDGLIICTPNYTHIDIIRIAIKSGKHILLEKPMATTVSDAFEILNYAKTYPATLQVGLQYRYKAMYLESIHEALKRKSLGELKLIQITEHRLPFLDKVKQWNKFNEYSGGTLVEKCCHYFDLLNLFAQSRPKLVYATGSMAVNFKSFEFEGRKSDILDNAIVTIEYENGIRASFSLCMFSPQFYEEITICGDEGRLKAFENQDFLKNTEHKCQLEIYTGELLPSRTSYPHYPSYIESSGHHGATFFEHKKFIDSIEGHETDLAKPEEGFWSVVVGYAAQESITKRKPILIEELLKDLGISIE